MALRQHLPPGSHSRRVLGASSAPAVVLRTPALTQAHAQPAASRAPAALPSPSSSLAPAPATLLAAGFPAPTASAARRAGPALHVCAAKSADKELRFDVEVEVEELSLLRRRASVTVPARAVKDIFKRGVKRLERDVVGTLRGWQAGKPLPLSVVIANVGGQEKFKSYCMEELLLEVLPKAVDSARQGKLVDTSSVQVPKPEVPDMLARYDPAQDFTFNVVFDVAPPVVWRTPLEELSVTVKDTGDFSTDADAADDLIRQYRKQHGFSRVVASRGLAMGDTLVMDMEIRSKATGQPLPGLVHSRISFDTEMDVLGITEGMLGMKAGEARTFSLSLPEDYEVEFWQNMPVSAAVKVHEIFEWTLPEFNDAYVEQHHAGKWRSATEMREALIATTAMQRLQLIDKALEDEVVKAVAGALDMPEVPPRMVEQLGERQFQAQLLQMIEDRIGSREDIEKLATEEMAKEFVEQRRKELEDQVRFNLAVDDIFASRGLQLDEEAVQQEFALRARQMQAVDQPFDREELMEDVRETVKSVTVIEWLKDNVKREVLPYNSEQAANTGITGSGIMGRRGGSGAAGASEARQGEPVAA